MEERRWIIVALGVGGGVLLLGVGLLLGAVIASGGDGEAAPTTTTTSLDGQTTLPGDTSTSSTTLDEGFEASSEDFPQYGSAEDRGDFVRVIRDTGFVGGSEEELLTTADEICYHLERLQAQDRSAAYAVRVVWNEALAPVESEDLAAFGTIFIAAPHFLCPESAAYAEDVSYWLGY